MNEPCTKVQPKRFHYLEKERAGAGLNAAYLHRRFGFLAGGKSGRHADIYRGSGFGMNRK